MKHPSPPPAVRPTSDHHLAKVTSVKGVEQLGMIEVRLLTYDGVETQDAVLEARLCVPVAGEQRGTFFCPNVGDEVLVLFVNGDPRQAVVMGSMWHGQAATPDRLGGDGKLVDRWSIKGGKGTRIAIEEEGQTGALIKMNTQTPSGDEPSSCLIDREEGGFIELKAGGTIVRIDKDGVSIQTKGDFKVKADAVNMTASTVDMKAGSTTCTGTFEAKVSVTTAAINAKMYSTGIGNLW
ncbi:MAG: phage baseplate assembly protein V [Myxococcota bacterium]